jgi:hypothetical protein
LIKHIFQISSLYKLLFFRRSAGLRVSLSHDGGIFGVEGDRVVVTVEVRVELAEEDITDDDVIESSRENGGHDTHEAFGLFTLSDLDNVILTGEYVIGSVEFEVNVGEGFNVGAVLSDLNAFNNRVNEVLGSDDEGSTRVYGSHNIGVKDGDTSLYMNGGEKNVPVVLFSNHVFTDKSVTSVEFAGNSHDGCLRVGFHVESE